MQEKHTLTCCWCGNDFPSEWHEAICCSGECYDAVANAAPLLAARRKQFRELWEGFEILQQRVAELDSRIRVIVDRLRVLGRKWSIATPPLQDRIAVREMHLSQQLALLNEAMEAMMQSALPALAKLLATEAEVAKLKKVVGEE